MSENVTWTLGRDALAISAPNQSEMTWQGYLLSLKDRVRELAAKEDDPVKTLEDAVAFHLGEQITLSSPEEIVDHPAFLAHLTNKGLVGPNDFPTTINQVPLQDPMEEMTLRNWIEKLM